MVQLVNFVLETFVPFILRTCIIEKAVHRAKLNFIQRQKHEAELEAERQAEEEARLRKAEQDSMDAEGQDAGRTGTGGIMRRMHDGAKAVKTTLHRSVSAAKMLPSQARALPSRTAEAVMGLPGSIRHVAEHTGKHIRKLGEHTTHGMRTVKTHTGPSHPFRYRTRITACYACRVETGPLFRTRITTCCCSPSQATP